MLDSVIRVNKKCYPQTLEECKYVIRKNKMENLINNDLSLSSSDKSDNESDVDQTLSAGLTHFQREKFLLGFFCSFICLVYGIKR